MAIVSSSSARLFSIFELLETILLYTNAQDILRSQRVSTLWLQTIQESSAIRHRLFEALILGQKAIKVDSYGSKYDISSHGAPASLKAASETGERSRKLVLDYCFCWTAAEVAAHRKNYTAAPREYLRGSWEHMLLSPPGVDAVSVTIRRSVKGGPMLLTYHSEEPFQRIVEGGMTLGEMVGLGIRDGGEGRETAWYVEDDKRGVRRP